jgi:hypothetical protein
MKKTQSSLFFNYLFRRRGMTKRNGGVEVGASVRACSRAQRRTLCVVAPRVGALPRISR